MLFTRSFFNGEQVLAEATPEIKLELISGTE
jgi:hypothetical protein